MQAAVPSPGPSGPATRGSSGRTALLAGGVIAAAALAAYHGTFHGPFVFDDQGTIVGNRTLRHLWTALVPPEEGMPVTGRPVANLSFAVNYALGGLRVWGYHAANLLIHIAAGLALAAIGRRMLPAWAAFSAALIWTVHPLQTESVTFISQRVESLMGLLYLLTLYCFIRYAEAGARPPVSAVATATRDGHTGGRVQRRRWAEAVQRLRLGKPGALVWGSLSAGACLLGMATKEVMVTAPLVVFLYDRTFVGGSFREAWRLRRRYYGALACTWVVLVALLAGTGSRGGTAGFNAAISWPVYAVTQFRAVAHYLRLAFWPHPLVFFYGSAVGGSSAALAGDAAVVSGLLVLTVVALRIRPALGFLGAWFFLALAPSSSVVPVATETIAEHRMYLPLAAVVVAAVLGISSLAARLSGSAAGAGSRLPLAACLALALACGVATERRNRDYRTEMSLWRTSVDAFPSNEVAQYNLAIMYGREGRTDEAVSHYREAIRLKPDYPEARNNLGRMLADAGHPDEAIPQYEAALEEAPEIARIHYNLGDALLGLGRLDEAIASYQQSLRLEPESPDACYKLGTALVRAGRAPEALTAYERAIRLKPEFPEAQNDLAYALTQFGRPEEALPHYREALKLVPDSPEVLNNFGSALVRVGRFPEAIDAFRQAVRLKPDYAEAHDNLGTAFAQSGQPARAALEFRAASDLQPGNPEVHNNLGCALAQLGRYSEARAEFEAALRLNPDDRGARANLGRLPPSAGGP
jgi:Flp pilus assembly protein TadD